MGLKNGNRGAQRGVNAAARRADASIRAANAAYDATGDVDGPAQRQANKDIDNLAAIRNR